MGFLSFAANAVFEFCGLRPAQARATPALYPLTGARISWNLRIDKKPPTHDGNIFLRRIFNNGEDLSTNLLLYDQIHSVTVNDLFG